MIVLILTEYSILTNLYWVVFDSYKRDKMINISSLKARKSLFISFFLLNLANA